MSLRPKPVVLTILDGFGCGAHDTHDAIHLANTPCLDGLMAAYPHTQINASEGFVGLPAGQMGNSEVGHMNIGAGRVVMQDLPRIDAAIASGALKDMPAMGTFISAVKQKNNVCHVMGLMSDGGVHAHSRHIIAVAQILADAGIRVYVHLWLDGRDTPPESAIAFVRQCMEALKAYEGVSIATISGRYYAMDRDTRWDRVAKAYDTMVAASGGRCSDAETYIRSQYAGKVTDEFVIPTAISDYAGMHDGDSLFMCNFRADRARQILTALLDKNFGGFARAKTVQFAATLGMTEYSAALAPLMPALFQPETLQDLLGEVVARNGLQQLRIAETEKYAHVTFFFNGGREEVYKGEERILIPSPKVATYDEVPEMSAYEVTDALVGAIVHHRYDFIVVNYANSDMVGHTGDVAAAIAAVEAVDRCIARVSEAVLQAGGAMLITADHGNAEQMFDAATGQSHTAHTLNLVPAIMVSSALKGKELPAGVGKLADIAPTILELLQLPPPAAMTGTSLLKGLRDAL